MKNILSNFFKNKKRALLTIAIATGLILTVGGYQVYASQQAMEKQRLVMQKQRQVMIDHYKAEGFTDEEIQQKMREEFQAQRGDWERPWYFEILRTVRHATGTGPGVGGSGRPMRDGGQGPSEGRVAGTSQNTSK